MSLLRGLAAILLAWAMATCALAGELPPPPKADSWASARVFVQLVINGEASNHVVPLNTADGHLLVEADELREAGLIIADKGAIDLNMRFDIRSRYNSLEQRLYLDVPVAMLPTRRLHGPARPRVHAEASTGAAFNYDLYVQRSQGATTASLETEQRVFGRLGSLSNSGALRVVSGRGGVRSGYLRYDTRYRYVDQQRALAVTAGDLITGALPWSTSVRLGGVQIGRSFAARPDLVTTPLPSFAGEAAVPSAVDLFIDGYRQGRTDVSPGRFVLDNLPLVNGAGQARIVTTDAAGRQIATTIPFYVSASLLRPGLTDFSAEAGLLRGGYGLKSFDYGPAAASFFVRRGVTRRLTVESHGEASKGLVLGGVGVVWAPGLWGTVHGTIAVSRSRGRAGTQWTAGYEYSGRDLSIAFEHREVTAGFRDLGDFDLAQVARTSSDRVVATANLNRWGSLGFSYIDLRSRGGERARLLAASWSLPMGRASVFASADYDLRRHSASAQVRLVIPFGRSSVSGGIDVRADTLRAEAQFDRAVPTDGGWGLSAGAATDQRGGAYGQATARLYTSDAQLELGGSVAGGRAAAWAGVRGSLVAMDGGVFAANDPSSSFAVVSTEGVAGVPVTYENQPIGKTDAKGRLFVPNVTPYYAGRFAIDPLGLGAGFTPSVVEAKVSVAERAGAVVRMPIRHTREVTASLIDAKGQPIEPGSMATRSDGTRTIVGWDGIVYLIDVVGNLTLDVRSSGGTCRARLSLPATTESLANLGAIPCL